MQCFRLVNAGFVDKLITFDSLPDRLLSGIKTREVAGLPRTWGRWLAEIGSVRNVMKTETTQNPDRSYSYKFTPIGKEPCFFVLEYLDLNADREAWRAISEFLRMNVGPEVRLKEKIEDMAIAMAGNPTMPLSIECEDIPVIPVPHGTIAGPEEPEKPAEEPQPEQPAEPQAIKRRGRPKKLATVA